MSKLSAIRTAVTDYLSVSHKALITSHPNPEKHTDDVVIQTDLDFNITGWNTTAAEIHGQPDTKGKNLFHLFEFDFVEGNNDELRLSLSEKGFWNGDVLFKRPNKLDIYFKTSAIYINDEKGTPVSIMILCNNLNEKRVKEIQIDDAKKKYEILMNTLPQGIMILNGDGVVEACNKRGAEILGIAEHEVLGMLYTNQPCQAIKVDGSVFPRTEYPGIVSLQTGFPQRNVVMGIKHIDETLVWVSVNSEALIQPGEFDPYAVVLSYSDITEAKKTEEELRKSNERFYHVSKVSTDAIWDIDFTTNQIYRSGAFRRLSGYTSEQIDSNLNWWFEKLHPEDRERVKNKLDEHMQKGMDRWEDEYRFLCADDSYKFLYDSGTVLYRAGKPVRMLGAIRDLTEQKKLEKQLLDEQVQRHKAITEATIAAQEQEKANISRELHDNVNQILMSGKLFIETAKRTPEQSSDLLDKAIEYQLLALQEIRKLSKSLSNSNVKTVGLKESVDDIVANMKLLQQIEVDFVFNKRLEDTLSDDQKLMLFRIIQEQTNNIIKYSGATSVQIMINEVNNMIHLVVSDNGKGFDINQKSIKGIGFINIISRAEVYKGKANIISSPGNGCTLEICFPVS